MKPEAIEANTQKIKIHFLPNPNPEHPNPTPEQTCAIVTDVLALAGFPGTTVTPIS